MTDRACCDLMLNRQEMQLNCCIKKRNTGAMFVSCFRVPYDFCMHSYVSNEECANSYNPVTSKKPGSSYDSYCLFVPT